MKKVNYIQPKMQVVALMPTTIICASMTQGDPVINSGSGIPEEGD